MIYIYIMGDIVCKYGKLEGSKKRRRRRSLLKVNKVRKWPIYITYIWIDKFINQRSTNHPTETGMSCGERRE